MTDADKIRAAWDESPAWDFDRLGPLAMPEPLDWLARGMSPAAPPDPTPHLDHISFRLERGHQDGRPALRILGRLRETEVQVHFEFREG